MFRYEIEKIVKSKKYIIVFAAIFFLTIPDLISNWYSVLYPGHFNGYEWVTNPCMASFLGNSSTGHIPQIIVEWLLPIILLIIGCDSATAEKKLNCKNIYIASFGRKKYYLAKLSASFIVPSVSIFMILFVNWIICLIVFKGGLTFASLERQITQESDPFLYFQFQHPFFIYFIYIIIFCLVVGVCAVMCQCVSILTGDSKKTYLITFALWIFQFATSPYLPNAIQPFTETSLSDTIWGIARCLGIALITFIVMCIVKREKNDEI